VDGHQRDPRGVLDGVDVTLERDSLEVALERRDLSGSFRLQLVVKERALELSEVLEPRFRFRAAVRGEGREVAAPFEDLLENVVRTQRRDLPAQGLEEAVEAPEPRRSASEPDRLRERRPSLLLLREARDRARERDALILGEDDEALDGRRTDAARRCVDDAE